MRKLVKQFEVGISGKYQTYRFSTSVEHTLMEYEDLVFASAQLEKTVVDLVFGDIQERLECDVDFATVYAARQEELEKYRKYQENQAKLRQQQRPV